MNILSVCTNLPSIEYPVRGLFVQRRLEYLSKSIPLRALLPQPWFPFIKPRRSEQALSDSKIAIDVRPMFYLPKFLKRMDGWWMDRCVERWLNGLAPEMRSSAVIDAHFGYPEGVGCYRVAKRFGLPVFLTIRGLEIDHLNGSPIRPQLVQALKGATGVIAVSDSLRNAAIDAGVDPSAIQVIGNGVDSQQFRPTSREEARSQLKIKKNTKLVVCVGNLKPVKGHDVLLRAVGEISDRSDLLVVCVGQFVDPAWTRQLNSMVEDLEIESHIRFVGGQSPHEVATWLNAADLFALASHREGCCNAILESLACGTPVAATLVGDNSCFVHSGVTGELVAPGDHQALGAAIQVTLKHSYESEAISESVRGFTWNATAESIIDFMKDRIG